MEILNGGIDGDAKGAEWWDTNGDIYGIQGRSTPRKILSSILYSPRYHHQMIQCLSYSFRGLPSLTCIYGSKFRLIGLGTISSWILYLMLNQHSIFPLLQLNSVSFFISSMYLRVIHSAVLQLALHLSKGVIQNSLFYPPPLSFLLTGEICKEFHCNFLSGGGIGC